MKRILLCDYKLYAKSALNSELFQNLFLAKINDHTFDGTRMMFKVLAKKRILKLIHKSNQVLP
jgi:hypothetical protein